MLFDSPDAVSYLLQQVLVFPFLVLLLTLGELFLLMSDDHCWTVALIQCHIFFPFFSGGIVLFTNFHSALVFTQPLLLFDNIGGFDDHVFHAVFKAVEYLHLGVTDARHRLVDHGIAFKRLGKVFDFVAAPPDHLSVEG